MFSPHLSKAPHDLPIRTLLEPTQGGRTGQRRRPLQGSCQGDIGPYGGVVVEIFIAHTQPLDPRAQQAPLARLNQARITRVGQDPIHRRQPSLPLIDLPQQEHATITGNVAAGKLGLPLTALTTWKWQHGSGTLCDGGIPLIFWSS